MCVKLSRRKEEKKLTAGMKLFLRRHDEILSLFLSLYDLFIVPIRHSFSTRISNRLKL